MRAVTALIAMLGLVLVSGCESSTGEPPPVETGAETPQYIIGPLDSLNIIVWRNPELSLSVPVRPDGKVTTPLVEDVQASGKSPRRGRRTPQRHAGPSRQ